MRALEDAIEKAGGLSALSRWVGCERQAILQWRQRGMVPPGRALQVEDATGIKKELLRPDFYK